MVIRQIIENSARGYNCRIPDHIFVGNQCKKCGAFLRYKKNKQCIACRRIIDRARVGLNQIDRNKTDIRRAIEEKIASKNDRFSEYEL